MPKKGKQYRQAKEKVAKPVYTLEEVFPLLKEAAFAKFNETVDISLLLGVNPRHADQMVRGTVVLPFGTGKKKRVLVIAAGEKLTEAEDAGADFFGGQEVVEKIQQGWLDFDAVVATPDMMKHLGKLGRVLGPRGLMPNPKTGTVTFDVAQAVQEIKAGKVEFKVDKTATINAPIGKLSFEIDQLTKNAVKFIQAILKAKPAAAKGKYIKSIYLSSTMGPGFKISTDNLAELG